MKANEYMKHMMKTVLNHKYKEGIKRELQDCIDDLKEAFMEEGMSEEEAEEEAIKQMGDPHETAEMFNEVYQPRFEWKSAAYMLLWIVIFYLVKWGFNYGSELPYTVIGNTFLGSILIVCGIGISYMEKSGDLPFLWWKTTPTKHWAMPGLGAFSNSASISGMGIGFLAANIQQIILLYGFVTVIMLLQRLFIEIEQTKMEQHYLFKDCVALKDFDFEGPVNVGDEKHKVRIVKGEVARKDDNLVIVGMKGFTFVVDKL